MNLSAVKSAVLALLLSTASAVAQTMTTADIAGLVTDASGAVVPNATVTLTSTDTNQTRATTSGSTGQYRFSLVAPGPYTIVATTTGLKSNVQKLDLLVGQGQQINLVLSPQSTQQVVQVTGEASLVQSENANLETSFNTKQIKDLPMNGGDITTIAFTVPGVLILPNGGGAGNMNANGVPGASLLYTLNGADEMDPYLNINTSGSSNNLLGSNEIAEAAVVLNAYSVQYGRMAAGQINYVTKSGSNTFHGNLFYDYNGRIMNANDYFKNLQGTPRPRSDAHQFGGSVGGPIIKNKTFFFFNLEELRYVLPSTGVVTLPSPQFEQYTLTHVPAASVPFYQSIFNLYNGAPEIGRAVPVTNGTGPLQDSTGHLGCQSSGTFSGTYVNGSSGPQFGVNVPCALAFGTNVNQKNTESYLTARVDHSLTDKQKLNFRFKYDWGIQATGASPINPAFTRLSNQPESEGQMTYTYVITPTLVNNFVGSGSWYTAYFGVADFNKAVSLLPDRITVSDGGSVGNTGFTGIGAAFTTGRDAGQGQAVDDLSWVKGSHTLKVGVNYRYDKITDTSIGSNAVSGNYTFQDLTDFATGQVNSTKHGSAFTQSYPLIYAAHLRMSALGFYGQDEWNVRSGLKLMLGIRFERNGNPVCIDNCFSRMNQQFGTSGYHGGATIPYNQTITTGLRHAYQGLESLIPEPRMGIVFTPFGANKTVFRGGIGLFADLFPGTLLPNVFRNSPEVFSPSVPFGTVNAASDPNSSAAAAFAADQGFEAGFKQGYNLSQIQAALGKVTFSPPSYYSPPATYRATKVVEWSFEIEQPLTARNVFAATYAGNHGYNETVNNADANSYVSQTGRYASLGFGGLPTAPADPRFLTVTDALTTGYSNYDALTVQLRHAFSLGFQGQVGYTWSHALGIVTNSSSGIGALYNPFNLRANYSSLPIDVRNALVGDFVWTTPWRFHNHALNLIAGGWTIGAKLYVYSGRPFSATNSSLPGLINSGGGIGSTVLASLFDQSILGKSCSRNDTVKCFTAAQFGAAAVSSGTQPANVQTTFGNIPPNSFRGPGYFDVDTNLYKDFRVFERLTFTLGAQVYNTLNHANFANPSGSVTSSGFGLTTTDLSPPTSIYGSGQGAIVAGRVLVVMGRITF